MFHFLTAPPADVSAQLAVVAECQQHSFWHSRRSVWCFFLIVEPCVPTGNAPRKQCCDNDKRQ